MSWRRGELWLDTDILWLGQRAGTPAPAREGFTTPPRLAPPPLPRGGSRPAGAGRRGIAAAPGSCAAAGPRGFGGAPRRVGPPSSREESQGVGGRTVAGGRVRPGRAPERQRSQHVITRRGSAE